MTSNKPIIYLIVALALFVPLYYSMGNSAEKNGKFTEAQKQEIEKIVHDYFINNPDAFRDVLQAFQQKSQEEMLNQVKSAISANAALFTKGNAPVIGNPEGDTVLVEFLDYNCVHCKSMESAVESLIKENPSLRVVIRQYPIFGDESFLAAQVALAAEKQGKFETLHEAFLESTEKLDEERIYKIAEEKGLDVEQLKNDINSNEVMGKLTESMELGSRLSIRGTPYFIIMQEEPESDEGVEILPGATTQEHLQQTIDKVKKSN